MAMQQQLAPNRLGVALGYLANAYRYAFPTPPPSKADQRRMAYTLLDRIADSGKYNATETIDTALAIRTACTSAWFYSGVKLISDRVAATDARPIMNRRVGDELRQQPNHPFAKLLDRPNSLMTWEFIIRYTVGWLELLGNGYIFISTPAPGEGTPDELWPLPANAVTPLPKSVRISKLTGKLVIDYGYELNGKVTVLPGENVIHIRYANPFDYWMGLSPLTALMDAVRLDRFQSKYLQGFFGRDNAIPTAIISLPQDTNENDFEVIKEQIREQFGQGRRSAITRAGDITVETITQTLHEMQIVEARKFNREEIHHVLGVPEGLVAGGASGDSRLATEITFARNTTQPLLDLISSSFDSALCPYYGQGYRISSPSIIPQDRSLAVAEYTAYSPDLSINENRKARNAQPMDLVSIMAEINGIREVAGLEIIDQPLDDVMIDLMLRVPVRLIPMLSSNTSTLAGKTSLRIGQIDAAGEEVLNLAPLMLTDGQYSNEDGGESGGSPADREDAVNQGTLSTGANQMPKVGKPADATGAITGSHFVHSNAGRGWDLAAIRVGQREELNRWRRIVVKEAEKGNNPATYEFKTEALPQSVIGVIKSQLVGADSIRINIIFETVTATLAEVVA